MGSLLDPFELLDPKPETLNPKPRTHGFESRAGWAYKANLGLCGVLTTHSDKRITSKSVSLQRGFRACRNERQGGGTAKLLMSGKCCMNLNLLKWACFGLISYTYAACVSTCSSSPTSPTGAHIDTPAQARASQSHTPSQLQQRQMLRSAATRNSSRSCRPQPKALSPLVSILGPYFGISMPWAS